MEGSAAVACSGFVSPRCARRYGPADRRVVVRPTGELDVDQAPALRTALLRALAHPGGPTDVVVDLSRVEFCNSSGLNVLIRAMLLARESGRDLRLAAPCRRPNRGRLPSRRPGCGTCPWASAAGPQVVPPRRVRVCRTGRSVGGAGANAAPGRSRPGWLGPLDIGGFHRPPVRTSWRPASSSCRVTRHPPRAVGKLGRSGLRKPVYGARAVRLRAGRGVIRGRERRQGRPGVRVGPAVCGTRAPTRCCLCPCCGVTYFRGSAGCPVGLHPTVSCRGRRRQVSLGRGWTNGRRHPGWAGVARGLTGDGREVRRGLEGGRKLFVQVRAFQGGLRV
ncbi:STAS domain-containing protein [Streptomyces sp. NPDC058613]|uniref:STAS domain-containing protein n=1 Tax=unclassified Streptomyces TaxID=2593676 RepID=UPI00366479B6